MSLSEFLLARIAEDKAGGGNLPSFGPCYDCGGFDPLRWAAECEAKRRIVDWAAPVGSMIGTRYVNEDGENLLRIVALPYADHPDYREEWKP